VGFDLLFLKYWDSFLGSADFSVLSAWISSVFTVNILGGELRSLPVISMLCSSDWKSDPRAKAVKLTPASVVLQPFAHCSSKHWWPVRRL
jgi:hypothetical protein